MFRKDTLRRGEREGRVERGEFAYTAGQVGVGFRLRHLKRVHRRNREARCAGSHLKYLYIDSRGSNIIHPAV